MPQSEIARVRDQIERAFRGPAWASPSLLEAIEGVSGSGAVAHPIPGGHSIAELVRRGAEVPRAAAATASAEPPAA